MLNGILNSKKDNNIFNLKEIDGIKFRVMWSNKILYLFLGMMFFLIIMLQMHSLLEYKSLMTSYDELIPLIAILLPLSLFLSYLNRKFLGKIVAVINEKGIYTKDKSISWETINAVGYHTPIPLTRDGNKYEIYCSLIIVTNNNEYKILHAPHRMIKFIKKYVPNVKVRRDNELIFMIIACIGIAFLIPIADKFNLF